MVWYIGKNHIQLKSGKVSIILIAYMMITYKEHSKYSFIKILVPYLYFIFNKSNLYKVIYIYINYSNIYY